jgi:acyl-CoA dehydrogenase family protein 9
MSTVKDETIAKPEPTTEVESFLKSLYQGHIAEDLVFPFPEIPADVKETVGAFADAWTDFDAAHLDSEKMDAEHHFPREAVKAMGELGVLGMTVPGSTAAAASARPRTAG